MIPQTIRSYLDDAEVDWRAREHPLAVDGSHLAQALDVSGHRVCKCLVVRSDGEHFIAVLPASSRLDMVAMSRMVGNAIELASEAELAELFPECEIGAAPPLGELYGLPVVLDVALAEPGPLYFRGGTHEDVIELDYVDYADLEDPLVAAISFEGEQLVGGPFHQGALWP
jgi:Ala-tRNA(Pro) deacylase